MVSGILRYSYGSGVVLGRCTCCPVFLALVGVCLLSLSSVFASVTKVTVVTTVVTHRLGAKWHFSRCSCSHPHKSLLARASSWPGRAE